MSIEAAAVDALVGEDPDKREAALTAIATAPDHVRSALAGQLAVIARDAALDAEDDASGSSSVDTTLLARACAALATTRTESAKACLLRIADEGTTPVKIVLARVLEGTVSMEGRAVLVHLLSDDSARSEAIRAIGVAPWPGVLPDLIEVAESDDRSLSLAVRAIARCGATHGIAERNAAADFLLELLDDDAVLRLAVEALLRFGPHFPGVRDRGRRLARESGKRRIAGLCLVAAATAAGAGPDPEDELASLAREGSPVDEAVARGFLGPLREDADEHVRGPVEETWNALALGVREAVGGANFRGQ